MSDPPEMSDYREYAQLLANRLRNVGMSMEPSNERSTVLLCAGYIAGQAMRIEELLRK